MDSVNFLSNSLKDTAYIATTIGKELQSGDSLLLRGDLGAGKSAFARALIQSRAGKPVEVPSPTYTLVQTYPFPKTTIYHYDLYRIGEPEEVYELEWEEAQANGICLIEWPERLEYLAPSQNSISIDIKHCDHDRRLFTFRSDSAPLQTLLTSLSKQQSNGPLRGK